MRFTPYVTVLGVVASIASALPTVDIRTPGSNDLADFVDRDGTALDAFGVTTDLSPLATRTTCVKLPKAGKLKKRTEGLAGFDDDDIIEYNKVWYMRGDTFEDASRVKAGEKIKVYNLSGCSAIFVIGADGLPTTFHITAGHEATLAKSAATYIQAQEKAKKLTPKTILVYTREGGTTNYNDIVTALGTDLKKLVTHKTYAYNPATASNTKRWQLVLTVGTTDVVATEYDAECETGV
ncbi:hypothetical protein N0V93_004921 [Gnomoniopsis smithogilvyi]|uniref:Uncharacterized protein n=1 Tax=Gnomoniopsis smithogilvyi TaxID=1191159 RepID=A0A9W8YVP8_9PEZI|nr:hypothetical protein N0V93_004921 [Gnomoniopsis smithogilvyi]